MHKLILNNPNTHGYYIGSCMHESFYPWSNSRRLCSSCKHTLPSPSCYSLSMCGTHTLQKKKGFPALGISIYIHLQRRDKMDEKLSTYYIHICKEKEREERERSSLQSKHEGKMMVGSSPGSCTPMQVQVSISHCCTREASMNRQLQPTTSPPGLDRRELFDRFSSPSSSSSSSSSSSCFIHPIARYTLIQLYLGL